jgi:hypothetical protein
LAHFWSVMAGWESSCGNGPRTEITKGIFMPVTYFLNIFRITFSRISTSILPNSPSDFSLNASPNVTNGMASIA